MARRKRERMHKPPKGAVMLDKPMGREELIMSVTTKMPDRYEDLDLDKRNRAENVVANLNNGMILLDACKAADISDVTFYRYRRRYPWIQEAMEVIRAAKTQIVEDALFKSVTGYDYEVMKETREDVMDEDGNKTGKTKRIMSKHNVHVSPVVTAAIFWLKNRSGGEWRNDHFIEINSTHTERKEMAMELEIKNIVQAMGTDDLRELAEMGTRMTEAVEARRIESSNSEGEQ